MSVNNIRDTRPRETRRRAASGARATTRTGSSRFEEQGIQGMRGQWVSLLHDSGSAAIPIAPSEPLTLYEPPGLYDPSD